MLDTAEQMTGTIVRSTLCSAVATEADFAAALFGPRPHAEVVIAEEGGAAVGFALFFGTFSTFTGKPGLWLEDLFVLPEHRGRGVGTALLAHLAALAVERGCARFEWSVLDWNEDALAVYRKMGAVGMDGWTTQRLSGDALRALAARAWPAPVNLQQYGHELPLSAAERLAFFRCVQEGLTNALKHAPGQEVTVELQWSAAALNLSIRNPLTAPGTPAPSGGNGLTGLSDRLAEVGGTVKTTCSDRVFELRAYLPVKEN